MGSAAQTQIIPVQITDDDEAALFSMQLATASVLPMALKSALELDVFEIMAKNPSPMSPSKIASHLPTKNPEAPVMLDHILRLLTAYSVLIYSNRILPGGEGSEQIYGLGPVCKYLTKNEDNVSIAALCLMNQDKVLMESWYHLKDAILNGGIPFNKAYGMSAFEYQGTDPRFNNVFNNEMSNHSTITMKKILETYKGFEGLTSLVDVGGGIGATLKMVVSNYPNLRGTNFDLPHVIQDAPPYLGIKHVGGDMFVSVPKGDAIFMKTVDMRKLEPRTLCEILEELFRGDSRGWKGDISIVYTSRDTRLVVHVDCIMLAHNPVGKERTEKEFEALAKGSGFKGIKVVCDTFGLHLIELLKKL